VARIRTIKPEIWSSEQFVDCSRNARLLFIGMFNFADDRGVLKFSARTIRGNVFPMDDDVNSQTVLGMIQELIQNGLVGVFESQGVDYLHILTFQKHQRVDKPNPKHPPPPKNPAGYKEWSANDLGMTSDLFQEQSPAEGKGREGKGRESSSAAREEFDDGSSNADPPVQDAPTEKPITHPPAPPPSTPPPDPTASRGVEAIALGKVVLELMGRDPADTMHFGQVHAWLETGFKPEEIRAVAAMVGERMPQGVRDPLRYLGKAMPDEVAKLRTSPVPVISHPDDGLPKGPTDEQWRGRLRGYKKNKLWLDQWGPKPGEPGCQAPAHIIAEVDLELPDFLKRSA